MIKFENVEVVGFEHAIRGMRNPKNSWDRLDSKYCYEIEACLLCNRYDMDEVCVDNKGEHAYVIGPNDKGLMRVLAGGGPVHAKYRRMIVVYVDITAPLYWWKEFDTYKVGTVANSCSTMHKIHANEFTAEDFSYEHIVEDAKDIAENTINTLNALREKYLETKDKKYWYSMIQLLPTSYNQKRTVMMNYEVLANIYKSDSRLHHKLDEWNVDKEGSFCQLIEQLPESWIITGK